MIINETALLDIKPAQSFAGNAENPLPVYSKLTS